jgi:hypothetical protein
MFLITKYLDLVDENCHGMLETDYCTITSAAVQYPISIRNTILTVDFLRLVNDDLISHPDTEDADRNREYFNASSPNALYGHLLALYYIFNAGYKSNATVTCTTLSHCGPF